MDIILWDTVSIVKPLQQYTSICSQRNMFSEYCHWWCCRCPAVWSSFLLCPMMVNVGQNNSSSVSNNPGSSSILNTVTPILAILAFITSIIAFSTNSWWVNKHISFILYQVNMMPDIRFSIGSKSTHRLLVQLWISFCIWKDKLMVVFCDSDI